MTHGSARGHPRARDQRHRARALLRHGPGRPGRRRHRGRPPAGASARTGQRPLRRVAPRETGGGPRPEAPRGSRRCCSGWSTAPTPSSRASVPVWPSGSASVRTCACPATRRLVYGRVTGWGQEGPLAQAAGHDLTYAAVAGALAHIGRAGQVPTPPLNLVADFGGGGMLLALGIVAGLLHSQRTGAGQVVDAAMVDGTALLMAPFYGAEAMGFWSNERGTNLLDSGAPFYDVYRCADGGELAVGALEPQFFAVLLDVLGIDAEAVPEQRRGRAMARAARGDRRGHRPPAPGALGAAGRGPRRLHGSRAARWPRRPTTRRSGPGAPSSRSTGSASRRPPPGSRPLRPSSAVRRRRPVSTPTRCWPTVGSPPQRSPRCARPACSVPASTGSSSSSSSRMRRSRAARIAADWVRCSFTSAVSQWAK